MKILLDEHLPKAVAATLRRLTTATEAQHIAEWEDGRWLGEGDLVLLEGLWRERRILASYDRATLPGHLVERITGGKHHAGVIFVDQERFPVVAVGAMARALHKVLTAFPSEREWTDRIVTLTA